MKKILTVLLCVFVWGAMTAPAFADTSFSFAVSSRDGGGWDYAPHHGHHHRHWRRQPPRTTFYMPPPPIYVAPSRTVVYETTVVRPTTTIINSSLAVDQTSPSYYDASGRLCREYQSTGWVSGTRSAIYGTACLQPDGTWRVVD